MNKERSCTKKYIVEDLKVCVVLIKSVFTTVYTDLPLMGCNLYTPSMREHSHCMAAIAMCVPHCVRKILCLT